MIRNFRNNNIIHVEYLLSLFCHTFLAYSLSPQKKALFRIAMHILLSFNKSHVGLNFLVIHGTFFTNVNTIAPSFTLMFVSVHCYGTYKNSHQSNGQLFKCLSSSGVKKGSACVLFCFCFFVELI